MAKGFRKSKLAFWGIMCLGVLLSVLLWIRDRNYPVYIPIIALRIRNEEQVLERELKGYTEYKQRVRYKVIPFIW